MENGLKAELILHTLLINLFNAIASHTVFKYTQYTFANSNSVNLGSIIKNTNSK